MHIARTAAMAAILGLATTAWCQSEDPAKILDRALPLCKQVQLKAPEGSELLLWPGGLPAADHACQPADHGRRDPAVSASAR